MNAEAVIRSETDAATDPQQAGIPPGGTPEAERAASSLREPAPIEAKPAAARLHELLRRGSSVLLTVLAALLVLIVVAPEWFAPFPPLLADQTASLQPPSASHPLGTDPIGRDVLSRILHGARYSLSIGVGATVIAAVVGSLLGLVAGLAPRTIDEVLVRLLDVINAIPEILLALVVIAVIGPGPLNIILAIGIASIPRFARVVRVQVLALQHSGWVEIALTQGIPHWRRVVKHILPNTIGPVVVLLTIGTGSAILNAAGLSFLGLGPQPPAPEWGALLAESRDYFHLGWWVAVFPGLAVLLTVSLITIVGRRLQQRFEGRID